MNKTLVLFEELLSSHSIEEISEHMGVGVDAIGRWNEKKRVPSQYYLDLCKLSAGETNLDDLSFGEKDQFYTNISTAKSCISKTYEILKSLGVDIEKYNFIEPSAGAGAFYNLLPEEKRIGVDIEPKIDDILKSDFLSWFPSTENNICIGNPPFGFRGHMALKFINHASKFSDFVCFILPQTFDSNGRGSCKKRVKGLNLIHSERIDSSFFYPDGKSVVVNVVFKVWGNIIVEASNEIDIDVSDHVTIYSLSDGGSPGSTRNKKHINSCDVYIPSTCFGESAMKAYSNFEELPQRRGFGLKIVSDEDLYEKIRTADWAGNAFRSTNGAFNIRTEIIEKIIFDIIR